jgi:hypothetical protein
MTETKSQSERLSLRRRLFGIAKRFVGRDVAESLCVSLACYYGADLEDMLEKASTPPSVEELTTGCSNRPWPQTGGLSMQVPYKGDRHAFPLSPPFLVRAVFLLLFQLML